MFTVVFLIRLVGICYELYFYVNMLDKNSEFEIAFCLRVFSSSSSSLILRLSFWLFWIRLNSLLS